MNEPKLMTRFIPWYKMPEYSMDIPENFVMTEKEKGIAKQYHLTNRKIYWFRQQVEKLGKKQFILEYPFE